MLLLFLLLIVAPLVELYVIIQVAHVIGAWETIALLIVESVVGAWLLKRQGLSTIARIGDRVQAGQVPGKELVDGLLIIIAGALMLAPGFIGDAVGYLLLFPPTRAPVRGLLMHRFKDGRYGRLFGIATAGGTRFVGTFRAGGDVVDTTGSGDGGHPRPSGELES